jgi:hypothetical protein
MTPWNSPAAAAAASLRALASNSGEIVEPSVRTTRISSAFLPFGVWAMT